MEQLAQTEQVKILKLVYGGQGLGELPDGRKIFVWNALPGETVTVRVLKSKKSYAEGIAEEVLVASKERIAPKEANYLATSPWQIMSFAAENKYKKEIVTELFAHESVAIPSSFKKASVIHDERDWQYRNKMEYSFWGDNDGLHLALHQRGSHGKQIVTGSQLALASVDSAANAIAVQLSAIKCRAGDLKTIIVRTSQKGDTVAALYTKLTKFVMLDLPKELKGLRVYHSNPKSPASVATKLIYELGDVMLQDDILGKSYEYDVESFFQVNIPIYEKALEQMKSQCQGDPVDMYAGVGTIGLSIAQHWTQLVEIDGATAAMARHNFSISGLEGEVIEASAEKSVQYIRKDKTIIFDPPRAGLHSKVIEKCLEILPTQIVYLSCNPATQARDLRFLQESYDITFFEVYNFFPRTPHIETLAVLSKKV